MFILNLIQILLKQPLNNFFIEKTEQNSPIPGFNYETKQIPNGGYYE